MPCRAVPHASAVRVPCCRVRRKGEGGPTAIKDMLKTLLAEHGHQSRRPTGASVTLDRGYCTIDIVNYLASQGWVVKGIVSPSNFHPHSKLDAPKEPSSSPAAASTTRPQPNSGDAPCPQPASDSDNHDAPQRDAPDGIGDATTGSTAVSTAS